MKLKSNLAFTQHGLDQIFDGKLAIKDGFVEFDSIVLKLYGEFLEINLMSDGKVACVVDETMIMKDGWTVEIKNTTTFKVGVKVD